MKLLFVRNSFHRLVIIFSTLFILLLAQITPVAEAASPFLEEPITFQSHGLSLEGTLLVPETPGTHPAVVLVHGSNSSDREKYRGEAEMFAKAGIAAFLYDKREDGFSKSRGGSRSYVTLSEDVNAAVQALRSHTSIAPESIGLWGISEGAWVASLAASQPNSHIAFLITVGAVGVQPIQQQSWQLVNRLQDQGVSSNSMIRFVTRHGLQLAVSAGLFAEATYDPLPAFAALHQPVLAIWGEKDRVGPAMESSRNIREAFRQGGNDQYAIRFFPESGHLLRVTPDGKTQSAAFAPGYAEAMTSWVQQVAEGNPPRSTVIGTTPQQEHLSPDGISQLSWYHSVWLQLGLPLLLLVLFVSFLLQAKRKKKRAGLGERWYKILLAGSAALTIFGFLAYFGFIMSSGAKNLAPLLFDRTLIWFILQLTSFTALLCTVLLTCSLWKRSRANERSAGRISSFLLWMGGILLIPWALYWQLLIP